MSWRTVVVSKTSKLDYSLGYLVVRDINSSVKIHIDEISILLVENTATSITAALMNELIDKKIKVIFCDEKRNPKFELTAYYGTHDCSLKLKQQINWADNAKKQVWTSIVKEKIKNQALILNKNGKSQSKLLFRYCDEVQFFDSTNREGHAAKVYFNSLFGKNFNRDKDCFVNAALNYGYSIILSCFNREVVCSGYLTQLGLFHDNMFNDYNLSCDLMEPFRPLVDMIVFDLEPQKFEKEEKLEVLKVLNLYVVINSQKNSLINAIRIYCKSVFRAIEEQDLTVICYPEYEL